MKRWFSLMLLVLLVVSCEGGTFGDKSSTNNKSKGDDKPRPSEQGEGVVGYLVDPNQVRYSEEDGKTTVSGDPGAVEFAAEPQSYEACLQELSEESLSAIIGGGTAFSADVKGRGTVNEDGSFSVTMDGTPKGVLAVNVSGFCDSLPPSDFAPSGTSVVFRRRGQEGFEKGQAFDALSEPTPASDPLSLCLEGEECPYKTSFKFQNAESGVELKGLADFEVFISNCAAGDVDCADTKALTTIKADPYQGIQYADQNYILSVLVNGYAAPTKVPLSKEDDGKIVTILVEP